MKYSYDCYKKLYIKRQETLNNNKIKIRKKSNTKSWKNSNDTNHKSLIIRNNTKQNSIAHSRLNTQILDTSIKQTKNMVLNKNIFAIDSYTNKTLANQSTDDYDNAKLGNIWTSYQYAVSSLFKELNKYFINTKNISQYNIIENTFIKEFELCLWLGSEPWKTRNESNSIINKLNLSINRCFVKKNNNNNNYRSNSNPRNKNNEIVCSGLADKKSGELKRINTNIRKLPSHKSLYTLSKQREKYFRTSPQKTLSWSKDKKANDRDIDIDTTKEWSDGKKIIFDNWECKSKGTINEITRQNDEMNGNEHTSDKEYPPYTMTNSYSHNSNGNWELLSKVKSGWDDNMKKMFSFSYVNYLSQDSERDSYV